jgi:peptide/nickel transport system substrate-binding protein
VESVEALNSREVRFNLKQVFAGELQSTNIYPIPKHILVREDNLQNSDFNVEPVASGPFKLQEWNKGKWIEMVANPDYFRGRPPLDRMVFYTPSSMGELLSELVLGNVDLAYDLPPGNYDTLRSYLKILTPGRSYTYVGWNMARFPDKKLRQAFSMAIDRRKIISDVLGNYGQVVDGPITPEHWAYNPELKGLREDKEGSKKLIEELGYSKKKGQKFYQGLNVQILVEEGSDIRKKVAASIVSDLQAVGVQAGIVPLSGKDLLTRLFNKNFDAYILGWNVEKEFNPFQIWGSEGMYNFVGYKNSTIDNLIGEALLSLDREKAKKALYEFQNIIREDLPYTFLYAPKKITLVKKNIQGVSQDDKRPVLSFVDELWFRSVSGTGVELASLGEKYRKGPVEETKPAKGTRETPEQVLMATAPTLVPEKKPTAASASSAGGSKADTVSESSEPPPFVAYEVPPKPLNLDRVVFPYPEVARKLGLTGTVFLELWISKEGNVTNVVIIRSVHPILDKVAVENAKQLRFSPAIQGNKPVAVRYSFPVRFQE